MLACLCVCVCSQSWLLTHLQALPAASCLEAFAACHTIVRCVCVLWVVWEKWAWPLGIKRYFNFCSSCARRVAWFYFILLLLLLFLLQLIDERPKIKESRVASKSQTNKQTDRHRKRWGGGGGGGGEGVRKRQQSSGKQRRHRGRRHHVNFCLDEANVARVAVVPLIVVVVVAVSLCIHILCTLLSLSLSLPSLMDPP